MDKMKMKTKSLADENFATLAKLFPNAITETITGYDEDGKAIVERAIDADVLRQEISCAVVEGKEERYQFTWPDKKKADVLANESITATLRPDVNDSCNFYETQNLYIEGDNLDVLKLLHETYLESIKVIYIDPPYNTGKDFIYPDNFDMDKGKYLSISGQYDEMGNQLVQNTESNGRFHTDWLNMIYPRLKIARDLLKEDGLIFISIDDWEIKNMIDVCNIIFGEKNFIAQLIWQNKKGGGNDSIHIATEHEYILCYAKNKPLVGALYESYSEEYAKRYKEEDDNGKFYWDTFKRKSGKQYYPITCPDGTVLEYDEDGNPISWLRSKSRFQSDIKDGEVRIVKNSDSWSVQFKQRMPQGKKPRSIFTTETVLTDLGTTSSGASDVYDYFKKDVFSNPKPVELIDFLIGFGMEKDDIILDFFSGSGTTAEAVMKANASDNGNRKYILVQLKEDVEKMLESSSANAKRVAENALQVLDELGKEHVITDLAKERIKRCSRKYEKNGKDIGFRVLQLDSSNMKDVYYNPAEIKQQSLFDYTDNIKGDRTPEDLLFQVMLDLGVMLSEKIEEIEIAGKKVFNVGNGFLLACFDKEISDETVKEIAKLEPIYAVFRDNCMASDSVANNFDQIFESYSPQTIRKVL